MKFTKMHGCGNDYVYVDCTQVNASDEPLPRAAEIAGIVSDRHFGVGSDGLILICASDAADFRMDMYNADGSRGEMCGNGIRCVGKFVYDKGLTDKTKITVETLAGIKTLKLMTENGKVSRVLVDMGAPQLRCDKIPVLPEKAAGNLAESLKEQPGSAQEIPEENGHCQEIDQVVKEVQLCRPQGLMFYQSTVS